jgi:hypothetical protein
MVVVADDAGVRCSGTAAGADPTAAPQRWQNFAPGVSADAHAGQIAPLRGAPHSAQNLPVPTEPQVGHGEVELLALVGLVIATESNHAPRFVVNRRR